MAQGSVKVPTEAELKWKVRVVPMGWGSRQREVRSEVQPRDGRAKSGSTGGRRTGQRRRRRIMRNLHVAGKIAVKTERHEKLRVDPKDDEYRVHVSPLRRHALNSQ